MRWLRVGAVIWSGYFLLLMMADRFLVAPEKLPDLYWFYFGSSIALLLLLAFFPGLPDKLGDAFPIPILLIMGLVPFVAVTLVMPQLGIDPWFTVRGASAVYIRYWPPEFLVTLLLAYRYRMVYVVLYVLFFTVANTIASARMYPTEILSSPSFLAIIIALISLSLAWIINQTFQKLRLQQEALERANEELLEAANTVEELAISRERVRIARDLHDTMAHSLSGLSVQLETVEGYWDVDEQLARQHLQSAQAAVRDGLKETRRAMKALRASPLDELGLVLALRQLAETTAERADLQLSVQLPKHPPHLDKETEQVIFRVAQEATNNIIQHADADHMEIQLVVNNGQIRFNVCDDGTGFELNNNMQNGHYGIAGMRERAALAGGALTVNTGKGQGTSIYLDLPAQARPSGS
ncbi:MAG: sensor histidine kinase [Chloroflexota bacterium]